MPMSCPVRVRQVSAAGALPLDKSTRKVIVPRTGSDQIAFGIRSDSVRCPIRFRTVTVGKGGDLRSMEWGIGSFKLGIRAAEVDIII